MEDKETRRLSVVLTEEEVRAKSLELTNQLLKLEEAKNDLKSVNKRMKEDIEKLEKGIGVLTRTVNTGKEDREVECVERRNEITMTIETYRCDTGEMVATRAMTPNERQLTMFPRLRAVEGRVDPESGEPAEKQVVNGEPLPAEGEPVAEIAVIDPAAEQVQSEPITETVEAPEAVTDEKGTTEEAPAEEK